MSENDKTTRREFIKQTSMAGAGAALMLSAPRMAYPKGEGETIKSKGYAAFDTSGELRPWEFERRPVGDDDILIDTKYASICHSDIHQMKGDWGKQQYPQVPGHEIVGVVAEVGDEVTKFEVGDRVGVGCMVDSCMECESCTHGHEQHCDRNETLYTYGYPDKQSPTGITQGGYSTNIVVRDHFAVHIPDNIPLERAAPLLCAGITTYSPIMRANFDVGEKVGVAGIGGLGHMAVKLAVSQGAEVYGFTTSPSKAEDIRSFGAEEAIIVDDPGKLRSHSEKLDHMICTIPEQYEVGAYASVVKPYGYFTQVGMPTGFSLEINALSLSASRVNFNASLIGGMPETQEVVHFCADNRIYPEIQMIEANQISDAWTKVLNKKARYRYVIDAASF